MRGYLEYTLYPNTKTFMSDRTLSNLDRELLSQIRAKGYCTLTLGFETSSRSDLQSISIVPLAESQSEAITVTANVTIQSGRAEAIASADYDNVDKLLDDADALVRQYGFSNLAV